jgi:hypothetical protein
MILVEIKIIRIIRLHLDIFYNLEKQLLFLRSKNVFKFLFWPRGLNSLNYV